MRRVRFFLLLMLSVAIETVIAQRLPKVNIWEGITVHKHVEMTPFIADGDNNISVIVCPGGSYFWHDMETEGYAVAEWLMQNHISAFVLRYRTAYVPAFAFHDRFLLRGNQYPDAQNDLIQAIRYVRSRANGYRIDADKVGAMGFSAGGHLVMSVVEMLSPLSARLAFVAPVYPVVSMSHDCTHRRSRRGLLGEYRKHSQKMRDSLSMERHVPDNCPPVFIVNCVDDPVVDYRNSELLDSALTVHKITHKYIQYKTGGHGFGASDVKGSAECRKWRKAFLAWLKTILP